MDKKKPKVIIMTAIAGDFLVQNMYALGVDCFITKPIKLKTLIEKIRWLLIMPAIPNLK